MSKSALLLAATICFTALTVNAQTTDKPEKKPERDYELPLGNLDFGLIYTHGSAGVRKSDGIGNSETIGSGGGAYISAAYCFFGQKPLSNDHRFVLTEIEGVDLGIGPVWRRNAALPEQKPKPKFLPLFGGFIGAVAAYRINPNLDVAAQIAYKIWGLAANDEAMYGPTLGFKARYLRYIADVEFQLKEVAGADDHMTRNVVVQSRLAVLPRGDGFTYGIKMDIVNRQLEYNLPAGTEVHFSKATNLMVFIGLRI